MNQSERYMNTNAFEFDAVVLANGDYPTHTTPLAVLERARYVVCCDGAANEYLGRGFTPHAIVGDGDSLAHQYHAQVADIFHPMADQETNDQTKAGHFLQAQGMNRIVILGATGKREDHTLGNISLLIDYMKEGIAVIMLTDTGIFTPASGTQTFTSYVGQQISIFNFGATGLQSDQLVYPLSDFTTWWHGTLNESKEAYVTLQAEGNYLVFQSY